EQDAVVGDSFDPPREPRVPRQPAVVGRHRPFDDNVRSPGYENAVAGLPDPAAGVMVGPHVTDVDLLRIALGIDGQPAVAVVVHAGVGDRNAAKTPRAVRAHEVDANVSEAAHVHVADGDPVHGHAGQVAGESDAVAHVGRVTRADDLQVRDRNVPGV